MLNLSVAMQSGFGNGWYDQQEVWARQKSVQLFDRIVVRGRLRRIWSRLIRQPHQLLNLAEVQAGGVHGASYYGGLQTVVVDRIRGSLERSYDFDDSFFPYREHVKERWVRVAMARHLGISLPPVRLVQVGSLYFVEDGHHRISVARALGQEQIEAEVTIQRGNPERLPEDLARKVGLFKKGPSLSGLGGYPSPIGSGWPRMASA